MEIIDILQFSVLGVVALIASVIDVKTQRIPNLLVLILLLFWLGFSAYRILCLSQLMYVIQCLLTGFGLFILFLLLLHLMRNKNAFGMGDIKYLSVIGMYLGFFHSCICIIISCIAFILFSVVTKNKSFAFAPFIFIGIIVSVLLKGALFVANWL